MIPTWKNNWQDSKKRYLDWWSGKGLIISMWEHLEKHGRQHEPVIPPSPPRDIHQFWFDPDWRAAHIHYQLSKSSFKADILPVANTHLGPGSLAAILGAELEGREDTIWIKHRKNFDDEIIFNEENRWWQLHLDLLRTCKKKSGGKYFVGCPDLIEGLDTLAGLRGTQSVLTDMILRPEVLEAQLQKVNDVYFRVFDIIYDIIREEDEMAFCCFSLWGPGKVSKLQCDISGMISEEDFRRFALPYLREQCQKIEYTLYHLDGVAAIRHLDAILEIEELNAVQWSSGEGEPQGGDECWYDMYKKILATGKSLMPCWVEISQLRSLLDSIGADGLNILMHFKTEKDIDEALRIAEAYR